MINWMKHPAVYRSLAGLVMLTIGITVAAAATSGSASAVVGTNQSAASTPSPITDRFAIQAAWWRASVSTDARIDDTAGGTTGTPFSAEQDFGMPDSLSRGHVEFMVRLKQRGKLRFDMLDLARKGSVFLTRTINYGNQTYVLGERVNSQFNWRALNFSWTYELLHNDRFEAGLGLGLHLIQAEAVASVPTRTSRESFDGAGPFVTIAGDATWRITRRFALTARAQTFKLTVSDITGMLADYHADLQFRWRPNLAFGLGYQSNRIELDAPNENPAGNMQFDVSGPELFLRASF
jgi:hypothetical protein